MAWLEYTQEKKRKKCRYNEAMEYRRMLLLRNGATKWLQVAGDVAEMRQKFAAQRGAEVQFIGFCFYLIIIISPEAVWGLVFALSATITL